MMKDLGLTTNDCIDPNSVPSKSMMPSLELDDVDQGIIADFLGPTTLLQQPIPVVNPFESFSNYGGDNIMTTRRSGQVKVDTWLSTPQPDTPYVEIVEQPKQKELRFRYECEGRSAGSIPGENSSSDKKTYPTIQIKNYKGPARVVVSCVTREKGQSKPRPHPHGLVGKDCKDGICKKSWTKGEKPQKFENLGVQCIKKKEIVTALEERGRNGIDPYNNFTLTTKDAKKLVAEYDLTVVCLCFQVYIANNDAPNQPNIPLEPVITQPVFDKKGATLQIARVDRKTCSVRGDEELFILCDKVQRDDIKVMFMDDQGWIDYGDFGPTDIHRQVAIVCKIPAYKDLNIQQPKKVRFKLIRPSDKEESQEMDLIYTPEEPDPHKIGQKRKRNQPCYESYMHQDGMQPKVARRSTASSSQGKAPAEAVPNMLPTEKFYSSASGNTGKVIEQGSLSTIDSSSGIFNFQSPGKGIDDADVQFNLGGEPSNPIDESGVTMNLDMCSPYNLAASSSFVTPVSVASPMDTVKGVFDILGPMSDGYQNVVVEEVPSSNMAVGNASDIEAAMQQILNGGDVDVIAESDALPSLSTFMNEADIALLQQQILQSQERQLPAVDENRVGDDYIMEDVHDSLNIPVFNSIDIGQVQDIQSNSGATM
ncbi:uncharacterized protein [Antedon mediterranea]|uniref:uncharacterized protein isoform X2 n=1 Tax=Antedon mediterranea TaxID=105859 RepID=UPI003AF742F6